MAYSAARARVLGKAVKRGILRNLKWELDDFERRIENNELDEKTKAELRKALATIRKLTNIEGLTVLDQTCCEESDKVAAPFSFQHGQERENPGEEATE